MGILVPTEEEAEQIEQEWQGWLTLFMRDLAEEHLGCVLVACREPQAGAETRCDERRAIDEPGHPSAKEREAVVARSPLEAKADDGEQPSGYVAGVNPSRADAEGSSAHRCRRRPSRGPAVSAARWFTWFIASQTIGIPLLERASYRWPFVRSMS